MVDHTLKSNEAPENVDKKLEMTVFWGMIVTFVVVVFVMLKATFG